MALHLCHMFMPYSPLQECLHQLLTLLFSREDHKVLIYTLTPFLRVEFWPIQQNALPLHMYLRWLNNTSLGLRRTYVMIHQVHVHLFASIHYWPQNYYIGCSSQCQPVAGTMCSPPASPLIGRYTELHTTSQVHVVTVPFLPCRCYTNTCQVVSSENS